MPLLHHISKSDLSSVHSAAWWLWMGWGGTLTTAPQSEIPWRWHYNKVKQTVLFECIQIIRIVSTRKPAAGDAIQILVR